MSVHIVQLICPERHCILAVAYDPEAGTTEAEAIEAIEEGRKKMKLNPWCGICNSRELTHEDRATEFATIEEAMPWLMETQAYNQLARAVIEHERSQTRRNN